MFPAAIAVGGAPGLLLERPPPSPRPLERHGERVQASGRVWVSQVAQAWVNRVAQVWESRVAQRVAESPDGATARSKPRSRTTRSARRGAFLDPAGSRQLQGVSCGHTLIFHEGHRL